MESTPVIELSTKLAALRENKTALTAQAEAVEKEIKATSTELLALMRAQDLEKFTTPIGTFYINTIVRPSIADKPLAFEWLREVGCGAIIQETVNSQTLGSTFRELMDAGKVDLLSCESKGIKAFVDESVRHRKQ